MIFILVAILAVTGFFGVRELVLKRYWRELVLYSFLFLCGSALSILQAMRIDLPDPNIALQYVFKDILNLYYK
ncbi:hypothetical protein DFR58_101175 [Anaerobacterium chartisolvens]|uniref:Uncharacterized protein n=1 Tax=Anaerobacterium chartisolvens TaxID=1297424 RepID=A0A369BHT5_9FIRM|nr:hypothetical protein [Anaerobacterium chartisolvens]RCX20971.1 hypothetical protein DFR58_101175 [Anaerobacterium chartisolvens]